MVQGPLGPDPSGKNEYVGEREMEREFQAEAERTREQHEAERTREEAGEAVPKKPSFWQRLFGRK
jgi:hypothetical protein